MAAEGIMTEHPCMRCGKVRTKTQISMCKDCVATWVKDPLTELEMLARLIEGLMPSTFRFFLLVAPGECESFLDTAALGNLSDEDTIRLLREGLVVLSERSKETTPENVS